MIINRKLRSYTCFLAFSSVKSKEDKWKELDRKSCVATRTGDEQCQE